MQYANVGTLNQGATLGKQARPATANITENMTADDGCSDCLGRVPYASLLSFLLSWVGVGLFCGMLYQALNATLRQIQDIFQVRLNYDPLYVQDSSPDSIRMSFIIVGILYAVFTLILLIIGALATGGTRHIVYSGWKSRLGGRISCAVFMAIAYVLKLFWLVLFACSAILLFIYVLISGLCPHQVISGVGQCLNFTLFAPIVQAYAPTSSTPAYVICGESLQKFCTLSDQALPWCAISFVACGLVLIGLVNYLICLAANYAHIKDGHKYLELAEIRYDDQELGTYGHINNGKF